jgi:hypothetical protein
VTEPLRRAPSRRADQGLCPFPCRQAVRFHAQRAGSGGAVVPAAPGSARRVGVAGRRADPRWPCPARRTIDHAQDAAVPVRPLTALDTGLLLLAGYVPHGGGAPLDARVVGSGSIEER